MHFTNRIFICLDIIKVNLLFWNTFSTFINKADGHYRIQSLHCIQIFDKPNSWVKHLTFLRSQIRSKCLITTPSAFLGWIVWSSRRWTKTLLQRSWQIPIFWRRQESGPQQTARGDAEKWSLTQTCQSYGQAKSGFLGPHSLIVQSLFSSLESIDVNMGRECMKWNPSGILAGEQNWNY